MHAISVFQHGVLAETDSTKAPGIQGIAELKKYNAESGNTGVD